MATTQIEALMASLAADWDCSEAVIQMLTEQEEDTKEFEGFLCLLRARVANYPRRFSRLSIASDKQSRGYYIITNYDYKTYKWVLGLELPKSEMKIDANKIYLRASALPVKVIKALEEKLRHEQEG